MDFPKNKRGQQYVKKGENDEQDGGERPRKGKRDHAKNRFQYPQDWKEELESTVTLETKIPPLPRKEEELPRPDFNTLKTTQGDFQRRIDKTYRTIDDLKQQQKEIRQEIYKKNTSVFAELKERKEEREKLSKQRTSNFDHKKTLQKERDDIDEKMSKLAKRAYGGKLMPKAKIEEIIKKKEDEFRNSKHTAAEEKKYLEEMQELKRTLPLINENEALRKERDLVNQKISKVSSENNALMDQIQEISGKIKDIKKKLDAQDGAKRAEEKREEPREEPREEGGEDKPRQKPKRELTQPEKEIREKVDKHYEEITRMKERREEASKKFDEENFEYEKQQFEIRKINQMVKIQKRLRNEEFKKKRAEEEDKLRAEEEEKAKELLQFKFREEIETCENLVRILSDKKPGNKETFEAGKDSAPDYKVDDKILKEENLVMIKPKKNQEEEGGVKPGQKRFANKKKDKKGGEAKEEGKLSLDVTTLQTFHDIKVMPPVFVNQIDGVIKELIDKKLYYEKLREEEIAKSTAPKVLEKGPESGEVTEEGERKEGEGKGGERKEGERKERRGHDDRKENEEKKVKKAKPQITDADFPSLS